MAGKSNICDPATEKSASKKLPKAQPMANEEDANGTPFFFTCLYVFDEP